MLSQTRQHAASTSFAERLPELRILHARALQEVLPRVMDELELLTAEDDDGDEEEGIQNWLEDWLDDLGQLFKIYKKHEFDANATLTALYDNLTWRAKNLWDLPPPPRACRFLRFLPHPLLNSSSSASSSSLSCPPILFLSVKELIAFAKDTSESTLEQKVEEVKSLMMNTYELSRMYLKELDMLLETKSSTSKGKEKEDLERLRIMQFALMVDVQGAGMLPSIGSEVASWVTKELAPNFPGMCSAVYVVNYSWAYSALWAVIKRVLPAKVLSRISFPSSPELLQHFPAEYYLKEHGGALPALSPDYDDIMTRYQPKTSTPDEHEDESASSTSTLVPTDQIVHHPRPPPLTIPTAPPPSTYIAAFSPQNPYFGYPIVVHYELLSDGSYSPVPQLVHGRRRRRDLIKTLAFLFVFKWRTRIELWFRGLVRAFQNMQASMWKRWHVLKTVSKVFGVAPAGGRLPIVMAAMVLFATLVVRLRRLAKQKGVGIFAAISAKEIAWLRDVLAVSLGGAAATAMATLPSPWLPLHITSIYQ